jgi:hypothetical protein
MTRTVVNMTAPEQVQMWKCPITGKLFDTPAKAEKSSKAAKAKSTREKNKKKKEELAELINYQSNYIRLNATTISEIPSLIVTKAKEFWDIDIKLRFENVRLSKAGLGYDTTDGPMFVFRVKMVGEALTGKHTRLFRKMGGIINDFTLLSHSNRQPSPGDIIFKGRWYGPNRAAFEGILLGSGSGGRFGESGDGLNMDARIELKTFPIIWKKYQQYLSLRGPVENYKNKLLHIDRVSQRFALQTKSVYEQTKICSAIRDQLEIESRLLQKLTMQAQDEYSKFCVGKLVSPPQIPQDLIEMFS